MENKNHLLTVLDSEGHKQGRSFLLILAAGLLAGVLYWPISYAKLDDFPAYIKLVSVAFLAALWYAAFLKKRFFHSAALATAGCMLAVMVRIIYDFVFYDPTSHNLWPIELFFFAVFLFPAALMGSAIGIFIAFISRKSKSDLS